MVQSQPWAVCETLSRKKTFIKKGAGGLAQCGGPEFKLSTTKRTSNLSLNPPNCRSSKKIYDLCSPETSTIVFSILYF
jgi:hypothetical protein